MRYSHRTLSVVCRRLTFADNKGYGKELHIDYSALSSPLASSGKPFCSIPCSGAVRAVFTRHSFAVRAVSQRVTHGVQLTCNRTWPAPPTASCAPDLGRIATHAVLFTLSLLTRLSVESALAR